MAKKTDKDNDSALNSLDLSQLKDLSFGPDWASDSGTKHAESNYRHFDGNDKRPTRSNKRIIGSGSSSSGHRDNKEQRDRRGSFSRRDPREQDPRSFTPFEPTVDVIFVSQDKPFEVLLKAMRTTFKTYELFEISRIILGKENRFVAIISPKEGAEEKKLYVSVPDQLPFETREEAINNVVNNHLERFFEISEVEVEPPSGNFQMVNRCKVTGELLAPPNFHRYQDILKEHYAKNISNLSFERFMEKVESVKDPEVVQQWLDKMKTTRQYTLKQKEGDETPKVVLSALEDVRYYLTTERKNEVFVTKDKIRLPGEKIELLPKGNIRRSIEQEIENQKRFPLITSNHLRGRLRRCNLHFFKKGSKGITYVCAVKRKPRYKDTIFSDTIQKLIDYIETHPKILVEELLKNYLPDGVETITEETQKTVALDLHWLIGAGYVSEFGNSELHAEAPLPINASEDKSQHTEPTFSRKGGKSRSGHSRKSDSKPAPEQETRKAEEAVTDSGIDTTTEAETTEESIPEASAPGHNEPEASIEAADEVSVTEPAIIAETPKAEIEAIEEPAESETVEQPSTETVAEPSLEALPEEPVEASVSTEADVNDSIADESSEHPDTPETETIAEDKIDTETSSEEISVEENSKS